MDVKIPFGAYRMGIFWKLLLITSSRKLEIRLMG